VPRKKPNRFAAFMNSPRVAAALLVVAAVGCLAGVVLTYQSATALRDRGARVTGEVVEVHTERRDNYVVVRFPDAHGNVVTADVGNYQWDPAPQVGDRPHLIYDPADPAGNVADERTGPDFFTVWALVLGALVAMVLVVPTWSGRLDWNKLR
jgi:hypothetical protein